MFHLDIPVKLWTRACRFLFIVSMVLLVVGWFLLLRYEKCFKLRHWLMQMWKCCSFVCSAGAWHCQFAMKLEVRVEDFVFGFCLLVLLRSVSVPLLVHCIMSSLSIFPGTLPLKIFLLLDEALQVCSLYNLDVELIFHFESCSLGVPSTSILKKIKNLPIEWGGWYQILELNL